MGVTLRPGPGYKVNEQQKSFRFTIVNDDEAPTTPSDLVVSYGRSRADISWGPSSSVGFIDGVGRTVAFRYETRYALASADIDGVAWTNTCGADFKTNNVGAVICGSEKHRKQALENLEEGKQYRFQVRAAHVADVSEPAELLFTVAKPELRVTTVGGASSRKGGTCFLDDVEEEDCGVSSASGLESLFPTFKVEVIAPEDYASRMPQQNLNVKVATTSSHISPATFATQTVQILPGTAQQFIRLLPRPNDNDNPDYEVTATLLARDDYQFTTENSRAVFTALDDDDPPSAPVLTATAEGGRVVLSWTSPTDSGQLNGSPVAITSYEVRWAAAGTDIDTVSWTAVTGGANVREYTATGLTNGAAHRFEVRAVNVVGGGTPGRAQATPINTIPKVDAGEDATVTSGGTLTLAGEASDSDVGDTLTVAWSAGQGSFSDTTLANAVWTAPQVSTSTDVTLTLTVTDADGATASDTLTVTVQPPVVSLYRVIDDDLTDTKEGGGGAEGGGQLTAWITTHINVPTITDNGGTASVSGGKAGVSPVADLAVNLEVEGSEGLTLVSPPTSATIVAGGDDRVSFAIKFQGNESLNDDYTVTVTLATGTGYAVDGTRNSVSFTIENDDTAPGAPTDLAASYSSTSANLIWTAPLVTGYLNNVITPLTGYEVRHAPAANSLPDTWTAIANSGPTTTSHTVTGLTAGTAYTFEVRAKNAVGAGAVASLTAGVLVFSPTSLTVDEDDSATYTVKLGSEPSASVTVTVGGTDGTDVTVDTDSVTTGNQNVLTFTTSDWDTVQTVRLSAAADDDAIDDSATLTHTASGGDYSSVSGGLSVTVDDDDTAGLVLTPESLTVAEESSATYTVKLASKPTADVTVTIGGESDGVTVDDTDPIKTGDQKTLTFTTSTWNTAQTVTVRAADDDDAADESVTLSHTASGGDYGTVSRNVAVTVTDNDTAALVFSSTSVTVAEESSATYTVKLATEPSGSVTVTVGGTDQTDLTVDTDSKAGDQSTLTFTTDNWNTAQTVTVRAAADNDGSDDTATLSHSASGGDYDTVGGNLSVTVTDNDTRGVTVMPTSLTIKEGESDTYTVKLNTQPTGNVTVTVGGASGDVSVSATSLTFTSSDWDTAQTVTVNAAVDKDGVSDDTVSLTHTVTGADYGSVTADSVEVTVTEKDTPGVTVTPTSLTIKEGETGTYTVVLNTQPTGNVTVTVGGASGDVTADTDPNTDNDQTTLTFTSSDWDTAQTVTVSAAVDKDGVSDDTVSLTHTVTGADYGSVTADSVEVTVTEKDTPGVTVTPTSLTIKEGETGTYTVKLNTQPTGNVTVTVGGASGDVTADTDPNTDNDQTTLTFTSSDWDTAQTVTVNAAVDKDGVSDDTVSLTHTVTGADYGSVTADSVEVAVTEKDTPGVTVTPTSLTIKEGESDTYTVVLNTQPTGNVTVTVGGASGDVSVSATSLTFTSSDWDTAQTVTVSAAVDKDGVSDDTVSLTHTVTGADYGSVTADSVEVTVTEKDTPGVTVTPTSLTIKEGESDTYTVKLNTQPTGNVTVTVGGASGDVTADTDPNTDNDQTTLTFTSSDWDTAQTVTVNAAVDKDGVSDDTVSLTHTVTGADYGSVTADSVEVAVTEKDTPGVTVTPTSLTIKEGESDTYTVKLNTQPTGNVTVTVGGASGDVTADTDPNTDNDQTTLTFTSSDWDTAQTVTVNAAVDKDGVSDDTVSLTHTVTGADYGLVTADSVEVTVTEKDTPGVTVTPTSLTIKEGESDTYTVVLNTQPTGNVTVTVGGASGDVTADTDPNTDNDQTTLTFTSSDWDTAQTVTVSAAVDKDGVSDDTVSLTHTVTGADYGSVTADSVEVTVTEKDTPGVTVTPASLTIKEGESDTYTVKLNTQPTGNVTVTVGGASGDVSVSATSLTFTSSDWDTAQTVTVNAAVDKDGVSDDTVSLTHTVTGADYGSVTADSVEVAVTEKDTPGVTVTPTSLTIKEGESDTYTVKLNTQPTGNVTVTVGGASGDVTADTDPNTDNDQTTLTFTSSDWDTAQTVTVNAAVDKDGVSDDTVSLTHTVTGADYGSVTADSVEVAVTEKDTPGVTVTPTSLTIKEGESDTYTVKLNTQPTGNVTVTVGGASGDVTADTDPNTDNDQTTLTFTSSDWDTAQTVTVNAAVDKDGVSDDTVSLTHTVTGADYGSVTADSVEVTVTEKDTPGVTVTPTSLTIKEGESDTYTVVLNTQPTGNVTVTVGGASGDVTADTDPNTDNDQTVLTFTSSDWDTAQTVMVNAAVDKDGVSDDTVRLTHTVTGADYGSVTADSVEVAVTEKDTPGVTVTPTSLTIKEGESDTYTVVLNTQPTGNVTVTVGGASGDVSVSATSLTFTSSDWDTAQTVTVNAAVDKDGVSDDTVSLTHTVTGADYGSVTADLVEVTITEKDTPGVTVTPTSLTIKEGESDTYTVKLNTQPTGNVTVTVGGASGDVTADTDPNTDNDQTVLTFTSSDWDTAQTVTVNAAVDKDGVSDDTVSLTHTVTGADYGSVTADSVEVTVTEKDTPGVTVTPTSLTIKEGESDTYTVKLNTQPTGNVTVTVGGASGDVTADTDPNTDNDQTTLTFTSSDWDTAQTVTVNAAVDKDGVSDDTVSLTHTVTGADYGSVTADSVEVTVTEKDTPGVTVTPTSLTIKEGESDTYTVVLNTQPTGNVTVTVGGASGDVTADTDPNTDNDQTTLTFTSSDWDTAQTVTVSAAVDKDGISDDTVSLTHTVTGADYGSVTADSVEVTVTEKDTPGVTVTPTSLTIKEGESDTYTVKLNTQPTGNVTVTVGGASGDVTADTDPNTDNDQTTLTFTSSDWDTAQTVTVSAAVDKDGVSDDTVSLTHTVTGADYGSVTADSVEVTVTEKDTPGVTVTPTSLTIKEGETGTYTVKLNTQPTGNVTVTVGGASGDVSVFATSLTFTSSDWDTAQTVTVNAAVDKDGVSDDTVSLTHTVTGADYVFGDGGLGGSDSHGDPRGE